MPYGFQDEPIALAANGDLFNSWGEAKLLGETNILTISTSEDFCRHSGILLLKYIRVCTLRQTRGDLIQCNRQLNQSSRSCKDRALLDPHRPRSPIHRDDLAGPQGLHQPDDPHDGRNPHLPGDDGGVGEDAPALDEEP